MLHDGVSSTSCVDEAIFKTNYMDQNHKVEWPGWGMLGSNSGHLCTALQYISIALGAGINIYTIKSLI